MNLSLFSVGYAGFWGQDQLDLTSFIRKAGQLGYDAVMLAAKRPHLSPLDATEEMIDSVNSALQDSNVRCGAIAAYTDLSPSAAAEIPTSSYRSRTSNHWRG